MSDPNDPTPRVQWLLQQVLSQQEACALASAAVAHLAADVEDALAARDTAVRLGQLHYEDWDRAERKLATTLALLRDIRQGLVLPTPDDSNGDVVLRADLVAAWLTQIDALLGGTP